MLDSGVGATLSGVPILMNQLPRLFHAMGLTRAGQGQLSIVAGAMCVSSRWLYVG